LKGTPSTSEWKRTISPEGALVLPRLPAGTEYLQLVHLPDDAPAMFSDVKTLELEDGKQYKIRFELKPSVRVEGRLEGPVARPVKNGRVIASILQPSGPVQGSSLRWHAATTMRIDGSFVFESMPRGNLQVIALCDGAMAESGEPPEFATDNERQSGSRFFSRPQVFTLIEDTTRIVLKMTPTADCLLRINGPDGQPVAGAKCSFWPNVGWWGGGSQIYCEPFYNTVDLLKDPDGTRKLFGEFQLFSAETNAQGEALIRNLPSKASGFVVQHDTLQLPGKEGAYTEKKIALQAGQRKEVTMRLVEKEK
jgi:hypothetical protein